MTCDILVDPPPPVAIGDTVTNPHPLKVSRIISMARYYFCQFYCQNLLAPFQEQLHNCHLILTSKD